VFLFGLAMGYLEAAVVVYLRRIYYPQGFAFPLNNTVLDPMFLVEPGRELATIVMLGAIAWLAGKNRLGRFSWFLVVFGIWDISYYLGLKALLNWPASLLTWDILFLIPIPWAAPVLSPVLVAASMIVLGLGLLKHQAQNPGLKPGAWGLKLEAGLMAAGAMAVLLSFVSDYAIVALHSGVRFTPFDPHSQLNASFAGHVPTSYPWWLLALGLAAIWAAFIGIRFRRNG